MNRNLNPQNSDGDNASLVLGTIAAFAITGLGTVIPALHDLWEVQIGEPVWTLVAFPSILGICAFISCSLFARGSIRSCSWWRFLGVHAGTAAILAVTPFLPTVLHSVRFASTDSTRWFGGGVAIAHTAIVLLAIGMVISFYAQLQIRAGRLRVGTILGFILLGIAAGCLIGGAAIPRVGIRGEFFLLAVLNLVLVGASLPLRSEFPGKQEGSIAPHQREARFGSVLVGLIVGGICQLWTHFLPLVTARQYTAAGLAWVAVFLGFGISLFFMQHRRAKPRYRAMILGIAGLLVAIVLPIVMLQTPSTWVQLVGSSPDNRLIALMVLIALGPGVIAGVGATALAIQAPGLVLRWMALGMAAGWGLFGWVGVPLVGMQSCLGILAGLSFLLAMGAWLNASYPSRRTRVALAGGGAALFLLGIWNGGLLGGVRLLPDTWVASGPVTIRETAMGVLTTTPTSDGNRLALNLRPLAMRAPQLQQNLSTHLACLRRGEVKRALLVNLSNGSDAVLMHRAERVWSIETTQDKADEMLRLSPISGDSSRVNVIVANPRTFLQSTDETFDVIVVGADAVPAPESASEVTVEAFEAVRDCLAPDGIYCHEISFWAYRIEEFRSLLRTFSEVFPDSSLWYAGRKMILMGAGPDAPSWNAQELANKLAVPAMQQQLSFTFGGGDDELLNRADVFAGGYLCGSEAIRQLASESPVHTDDLAFLTRERVEDPFHAIKLYEILQPALTQIDKALSETNFSFVAAVQRHQALNLRQVVAEAMAATADRELQAGNLTAAMSQFSQACEISPKFAEAHLARGDTFAISGSLEQAIEAYRRAAEISPSSAVAHSRLGYALLKAGHFGPAATSFEAAVRVKPNDTSGIVGLAWLLSTSPQDSQRDSMRAIELLRRLSGSPYEHQPEVLDAMAAALADSGDYSSAIWAAKSARRVALSIGNEPLAADIAKREMLYRQQKPYRSSIARLKL